MGAGLGRDRHGLSLCQECRTSAGVVMNRRGNPCLLWWAGTSALLFILGRHDAKGSVVISMEIGEVKNPNKNGRNVVPSQAGRTCCASGGGSIKQFLDL